MTDKGNAKVVIKTGREYRVTVSGPMAGNLVTGGPGMGSARGKYRGSLVIEPIDGISLDELEYHLHIDNGPVWRVERCGAREWIPLSA
jgi:hypothetical protein